MTARTTRNVVEVRIDGVRAGQLTPRMSSDLLPAIDFIQSRGRVATSRALLAGNRTAISVKLYVARSHELDEGWLDNVSHSELAG